ncbi:MAG: hypothetical protein WA736_18775 [Candidatus Acidiferrum sp.]
MNLKRNGLSVARLVLASVCVLAMAFLLVPRDTRTHAQNHVRVPVTHDWSTAHMVFSAPSSMAQAWRLQAEPRYHRQWTRRNAAALVRDRIERVRSHPNEAPRKDWGYPLLAGGTSGLGQFPAKFTFDVNAAPDCTNDFVVFNQAGLAGVAPTAAATRTGAFTNDPAAGGTVTITSPEATLVLTASATDNTGLNFQVGGGVAADATNLAAAIVRNNAGLGVTAVSAGNEVVVTALANGVEGNLVTVAKTLTHFAWSGAKLISGKGTGNIVAFNNLYSTQGGAGGLCGLNGPSVYWSYFIGTGRVPTSVVLSSDGTKAAFVESVGGIGYLVILKWQAGQGTGAGYPATPDITVGAGDTWSNDCLPGNSCMIALRFNGPFNDTGSSPYYDYTTDTIYVGDDSSRVHKFIGVFNDNAVPTEVTTGWPIQVHGASNLTSPVYDATSGNVYVGDSAGRLSFIREVGSTVGVCTPAPCLDPTHLQVGTGGTIVDSPIVDGTNGMVFAVNGTDTTNNGTVLQATTDLSSSVVSFPIGGTAAGGSVMYSGAFDNDYFKSSKPNIAGHMYVCGKDPANTDRPAIYQLSFDAATAVLTSVGTPLTGLSTADGVACSPVTEFDNPNGGGPGVEQDWIFLSFGDAANPASPIIGPCATGNAGCLLSVNVFGAPSWPPVTVGSTASLPPNAAGASSGIVVDNISTAAQASSIYFTLRANSVGTGPGVPSCNTTAGLGCAVKLTQSGLQ